MSYFLCLPEALVSVETNPSPWRHVPAVCWLSVVMYRPWPWTLVTWPRCLLGMTYWFALRLWSQICVMCLSLRTGFGSPVLLYQSMMSRIRRMVAYVRADMEHFANPSLSMVVAKCWFLWFMGWDRTVSGCNHLDVSWTQARGGTLDLLLTVVPDLVWAAVVELLRSFITLIPPICRRSFWWLRLFQTCVSVGKFSLIKHRVNSDAVSGAIQDLFTILLRFERAFVAVVWTFCFDQGHLCAQ